MTMALSVKNKTGFVDGSLLKIVSTNPKLTAWIRCNNMVLS